MPVTMQIDGLIEVQAWATDLVSSMTQAIANEVEAEGVQTASNIDIMMPVDTGWASMRFGDPAVEGGVFEIEDNGLSVEFGSDLSRFGLYEYITSLNEGSSKQAPAGFIDVEAERAGDRLEARLNTVVDTVDS